jgi:hypothetical protein
MYKGVVFTIGVQNQIPTIVDRSARCIVWCKAATDEVGKEEKRSLKTPHIFLFPFSHPARSLASVLLVLMF